MRLNAPTLPLSLALKTTAVAVAALGLALWPLRWVNWNREEQILILVDGLFLGGVLFAATILPLLFARLGSVAALLIFVSIQGGIVLGATAPALWHFWRDGPVAPPLDLLAATGIMGYLASNLAHYLIFADGYFYVSNSDNYFAPSWPWQILAWLSLALASYFYHKWINQLVARNRPDTDDAQSDRYYVR